MATIEKRNDYLKIEQTSKVVQGWQVSKDLRSLDVARGYDMIETAERANGQEITGPAPSKAVTWWECCMIEAEWRLWSVS